VKLRTMLLLGYAGFVLALGVLGAWSARTLNQMSAVSGRIIAENYDSVVAAQDMKESLERQDSAALFDLLGDHSRARRQVDEHRVLFDAAFDKAAGNVTEPGEGEAIKALQQGRDEYYRRFERFLNAGGDRTPSYFQTLEPQFDAVRASINGLLRLNQEAMRRKADAASRIARRWFFVTLALALTLMAAGIGIEIGLANAIVTPVRQLTDATTRLAAGELDAAVVVRSGNEIGTLAVSFNRMAERIRELRRSDMGKLLVAQQTTEAAIDSLYDPVVITDGEGLVTRINPAAERLFGTSSGSIGQSIEVVARDPRIVQSVTDLLAAHVPAASEDAAVLPRAVDGARRAFRIRSTPMTDADNRLVGVVTLLEDVTHLSEVSRLKSEFIAAASHELRTPLTSVQIGIHLLLEGTAGTLDERQLDILQICRDDTARLDRLMRELLDLSKIESGAVAPQLVATRPSMLLSEATDRLRLQVEATGVRLVVEAPPDLPLVLADRSQIDRVIGNLITNALRATPAGGTITVAAERRGDDVAFSVADTGSGISRDYLPRIFEPFVQVPHAAAGGAGLGLTISRRIVEGHGGRLSVQSEPGRGSVFTFTIRLAGERQHA
jgi:two-component system, NtrC family, sensor histidine kinase KinB